jgi:hypothetical protein
MERLQTRAAACDRPRRLMFVASAVVACGLAILPRIAFGATFSARQTHQGLVTDDGSGTTGALVPTGLFRRPGDPMFVYRTGGLTLAGVWSNGPDAAVVRSGTSESTPVIGRIVPFWEGDALRLTIEPAGSPATRTGIFGLTGTGRAATLTRNISTRAELEGTYRTILRSDGSGPDGWLSVHIDPEGATRFEGDLPPTIPPAFAAPAVGAIDNEVDIIHGDLADVRPLNR